MRRHFVALMLLTTFLATVAAAQGRPQPPPGPLPGNPGAPAGPGGPQPQGPPPDVVLKEILGFTDAQLTQLHALLDTRRLAAEALQQQIGAAERALAEAMRAEHPDPAHLGDLLLAVDHLRTQMRQVDEAFRTGFDSLLTADQKAAIEEIHALQQKLLAGEILRGLGV